MDWRKQVDGTPAFSGPQFKNWVVASQRLVNVRTLVRYVSEWITLIDERPFVLRPV